MKKPEDATPFERMVEFTRRLVAVPKSELGKGELAYQRRKQVRRLREKERRKSL
jgi:hypothetical protein